MNRLYNMARPRAWRRGQRVAGALGCITPILTAALSIAAVCALAYWQQTARAEIAPLRLFEVRQIVAAEDALEAALIACGPDHAQIVCEALEVSR